MRCLPGSTWMSMMGVAPSSTLSRYSIAQGSDSTVSGTGSFLTGCFTGSTGCFTGSAIVGSAAIGEEVTTTGTFFTAGPLDHVGDSPRPAQAAPPINRQSTRAAAPRSIVVRDLDAFAGRAFSSGFTGAL